MLSSVVIYSKFLSIFQLQITLTLGHAKTSLCTKNSSQDFLIFKEPRAYFQSSKFHPVRRNRFLCKTGRPPPAASSFAGSLKDADNHSRDQVLVSRARPGIINSGGWRSKGCCSPPHTALQPLSVLASRLPAGAPAPHPFALQPSAPTLIWL